MFSVFLITWLSVLPLIYWKQAYEGPKIIWFLVGGLAFLFFWIIKIFKHSKGFSFTKVDLLYLVWLVILMVSSLIGVHPLESIIGGSYRHQGVLFFFLLWIIMKTIEVFTKDQKKLLMRFMGLVVLAESFIVLYQLASGRTYFGKPLGTLGEANSVAGFLAIGLYFIWARFRKFYLLIPTLSVLILQSRAGILGLVPQFWPIWKKYWLVAIFAFLAVTFLSFSKPNDFFENRLTIWKVGLTQVADRPLFGFGAESGEVVYKAAYRKLGFPLEGLIIDRAHNLFLDVAMWSGLIGIIVFSLWLYVGFRGLKSLPKKLAFLTFFLFAMFQPVGVVHWVLLAVILKV